MMKKVEEEVKEINGEIDFILDLGRKKLEKVECVERKGDIE